MKKIILLSSALFLSACQASLTQQDRLSDEELFQQFLRESGLSSQESESSTQPADGPWLEFDDEEDATVELNINDQADESNEEAW